MAKINKFESLRILDLVKGQRKELINDYMESNPNNIENVFEAMMSEKEFDIFIEMASENKYLSINEKDSKGNNLSYYLLKNSRYDLLNKFIENNGDPWSSNNNGKSSLETFATLSIVLNDDEINEALTNFEAFDLLGKESDYDKFMVCAERVGMKESLSTKIKNREFLRSMSKRGADEEQLDLF